MLLAAVMALGWAFVDASDVIDLDASSFDSGIADKDIMLVEFYAPW